jgi:CubicO group peptidase (beta-lactamase class C family)
MAGTAADIKQIVDHHCNHLLTAMRDGHSGADVGISVALYFPDDPDVPGFFGYGAAGPGLVPAADTVYAIGSVSKVFTASLAAWLSVEGLLGELDQTQVAPYLSNPGCDPEGVSGAYWDGPSGLTFARLATQTSGMPDEANGHYSAQLFSGQPPSCEQIAWWNDKQSDFARDENDWIYSSAGFVTLGFAVAAAARTAGGLPALLQDVITRPLGMRDTFPAGDIPPGAILAQGYTPKSKQVPVTGAADLKSSARDMLAWLGAIYRAMLRAAAGERLTSLEQALAATAKTWIAQPMKPDRQPTDFAMGLGWQIPTLGPAQVLTKNGATSQGGCTSWAGLTRHDAAVRPVGIALMTNQDGVSPDATARTILQRLISLG